MTSERAIVAKHIQSAGPLFFINDMITLNIMAVTSHDTPGDTLEGSLLNYAS